MSEVITLNWLRAHTHELENLRVIWCCPFHDDVLHGGEDFENTTAASSALMMHLCEEHDLA